MSWKNLTKSKVIDWWEVNLRGQADPLLSLKYFNPKFMSLKSPHPIWTSAGSPFEVRKAVVAARMLSGRYRTDLLARHWSKTNPLGVCQLPGCDGQHEGNLEHLLLNCPALSDVRSKVIKLWCNFMVPRQYLFPIVAQHTLGNDELHVQFLLDPSCLPCVIAATRTNPDVLRNCFYLSRTWVFTLHVARTRLQKIWNLI